MSSLKHLLDKSTDPDQIYAALMSKIEKPVATKKSSSIGTQTEIVEDKTVYEWIFSPSPSIKQREIVLERAEMVPIDIQPEFTVPKEYAKDSLVCEYMRQLSLLNL